MENKYKYLKKICLNLEKDLSIRTPFLKKIKSKFPSIHITHLSIKKLTVDDLKPRLQSNRNEGGNIEPFGLYYSKNYDRLDIKPSKKKRN